MQKNNTAIFANNIRILAFTLLLPVSLPAQQSDTGIIKINKWVQTIEEYKNLTEYNCTQKQKGIDKAFTWFRNDKEIVKMVCQWTAATSARTEKTTQVFYLNKERLIRAKEVNVYVYHNTDTIGDGATYFFDSNKLIYWSTLGHGKYDSDEWDAEKEILKTYRDIRKTIQSAEDKRAKKTLNRKP